MSENRTVYGVFTENIYTVWEENWYTFGPDDVEREWEQYSQQVQGGWKSLFAESEIRDIDVSGRIDTELKAKEGQEIYRTYTEEGNIIFEVRNKQRRIAGRGFDKVDVYEEIYLFGLHDKIKKNLNSIVSQNIDRL